MKKLALIGLLSTLFITMAFSQGSPKKAFKRAKSDLESYNLDQGKKYDKLLEAKKLIDFATKDAEWGKKSKTWGLKGEIYNALASGYIVQHTLDQSFKDPFPDAAFEAYDAFKSALGLAEKKYQKNDALDGLSQAINGISTVGINAYSSQDFAKAYKAFNLGLEIHKMLKDHGKKSPFDDKAQHNNQLYITGLAALASKNTTEAGKHFEALKAAGFDKPALFDGLYKVKLAQKDTTAARAILAEGRQKYPEDQALLYSEINDYLKAGKMDQLVGKLAKAIEKDPKNASLHSTLGSVYDQLSQDATKAGKADSAAKNFDLAKAAYEKALAINPKDFATVYSIGTLYYNKAAAYTQQLVKLENDMSKPGMAKYNGIKKEMEAIFDEALPYFLKADKMNGSDANTLIALKEIYARKNDTAKAQEYKARLDKLAPAKE